MILPIDTIGQPKILICIAGYVMDYAIWCNMVLWTLAYNSSYHRTMMENQQGIDEIIKLNSTEHNIADMTPYAIINWLQTKVSVYLRSLSDTDLTDILETTVIY